MTLYVISNLPQNWQSRIKSLWFTDEETESQRGCLLPKVTQLRATRAQLHGPKAQAL